MFGASMCYNDFNANSLQQIYAKKSGCTANKGQGRSQELFKTLWGKKLVTSQLLLAVPV